MKQPAIPSWLSDAAGTIPAFDADPYRLTSIVYDARTLPTQVMAGGAVQYRYSAAGQHTATQGGARPTEHVLCETAVTLWRNGCTRAGCLGD